MGGSDCERYNVNQMTPTSCVVPGHVPGEVRLLHNFSHCLETPFFEFPQIQIQIFERRYIDQ